jgi:lysozyme family protein
MASFDLFLPLLLKFEGGYVDDPDDPGGETNKGITMAVFQENAHGLLGIEPTSDNLKGLTDAQAGIIYRRRYWSRMQGDLFPTQELADMVCDFFVNAGTNATALLQAVLNDEGAELVIDGTIGQATLQAFSGKDPTQIYGRYKQGRIRYYQNLVAKKPSLAPFLNGWLNRVNACPAPMDPSSGES